MKGGSSSSELDVEADVEADEEEEDRRFRFPFPFGFFLPFCVEGIVTDLLLDLLSRLTEILGWRPACARLFAVEVREGRDFPAGFEASV